MWRSSRFVCYQQRNRSVVKLNLPALQPLQARART